MKSYGDLPSEFTRLDNSAIVILPVPYDGTSTWGKGADKGPEAIIEASANMEVYDIDTGTEVYRKGIHTAKPVGGMVSPGAMVEQVQKRAKEYINEKKFLVTVGGEHSVTIGAVKAFADSFENLSVLQIDAHTDLRDEYLGSPFNHACVMARVREWCPIVQVGIRSMDVSERKYVDDSRIFYASDIVGRDPAWMKAVIDRLTENVYVTIDLDGLDPAYLPSTGTPEPGGLSYYEVLNLVQLVVREKNLVSFDVVELAPDPSYPASDFLAAKLIYQILSQKFLI